MPRRAEGGPALHPRATRRRFHQQCSTPQADDIRWHPSGRTHSPSCLQAMIRLVRMHGLLLLVAMGTLDSFAHRRPGWPLQSTEKLMALRTDWDFCFSAATKACHTPARGFADSIRVTFDGFRHGDVVRGGAAGCERVFSLPESGSGRREYRACPAVPLRHRRVGGGHWPAHERRRTLRQTDPPIQAVFASRCHGDRARMIRRPRRSVQSRTWSTQPELVFPCQLEMLVSTH